VAAAVVFRGVSLQSVPPVAALCQPGGAPVLEFLNAVCKHWMLPMLPPPRARTRVPRGINFSHKFSCENCPVMLLDGKKYGCIQ